MAGGSARFHILDADVLVQDENGNFRDPDKPARQLIDIVKVTGCTFFQLDDQDDVWTEIAIGNATDRPLRVNWLKIGFLNEGQNPRMAPTSYPREECDTEYLWNEEPGAWDSMYDGYHEFSSDHDLLEHQEKSVSELDRVFAHYLGQRENRQHVISTPVCFDEYHAEGDSEEYDAWQLNDLASMHSNTAPTLLPSDQIAELCVDHPDHEQPETHIDAINLWLKWEQENIIRGEGDIEFRYGFNTNSKIGAVKNIYQFYILPENAEFQQTYSEDRVSLHDPPSIHWLFHEWRDSYGIEKSETTEDIEEGRVLKSRKRNSDYIHNSATFEMSGRRSATETFLTLFTVGASGLTALIFTLGITEMLDNTGISIAKLLVLVVSIVVLALLVFYAYQAKNNKFVRPARWIHEFQQK